LAAARMNFPSVQGSIPMRALIRLGLRRIWQELRLAEEREDASILPQQSARCCSL